GPSTSISTPVEPVVRRRSSALAPAVRARPPAEVQKAVVLEVQKVLVLEVQKVLVLEVQKVLVLEVQKVLVLEVLEVQKVLVRVVQRVLVLEACRAAAPGAKAGAKRALGGGGC
ncbi:MAG: hypothetical protein KBA95_08265, partial [Acidobacteria bacterium]|nr:hypothetical protein [Acidobacteriota bacterium]